MRRFVQRALNKLDKLDQAQLSAFTQDLARDNERLEILLDSMTDGVLVCDKRNTFLMSNKAAERLLPLSIQHFAERPPVWELIDDVHISEFIRKSLLDQDAVDEAEFCLQVPGAVRIISLRIGPLVSKGRIQGTVISISDISEKRNREARLRRAESLAKLSTVAAGVAHEIKNPLGAISIHIQLIQRLLGTQTCSYPSDVNAYLGVITEEIDRLNAIVVDFLFAVRPMDIQLLRGDLRDVIEDVVHLMAPELEQQSIALDVRPEGSQADILMDERYIKQAILNLVKNAVHAMPEGGTLRLRTYLHENSVCLDIEDSGVGMNQEVLDKIFEPFFTTRDFGSGIGLTLVYKIVKEHGGEISVESQEGRGSTFTLSFPAIRAGHHLLPGPQTTENSGLRVLDPLWKSDDEDAS